MTDRPRHGQGWLNGSRQAIVNAVKSGAQPADVFLSTVLGLEGRESPTPVDSEVSHQLARHYREATQPRPQSPAPGADTGEPQAPRDGVGEPLPGPVGDHVPDRAQDQLTPTQRRRARRRRNTRAMTLRLDPDLHRQLRQYALDHDTHVSTLIRDAVRDYLATAGQAAR